MDIANSFNLTCTHERFCHPWCFERVYRQCYHLTEALRKVYGEDLPSVGRLDKRKVIIDAWISRQENFKKSSQRLSSLLPPRRESATVRPGAMLDKPPMALRSLLIEKLGEMEENKDSRARKASILVFFALRHFVIYPFCAFFCTYAMQKRRDGKSQFF
ncbi:unnamed protein product [Gongylonema pulchrum]|uniref:UNC80 domain-containing protein n=1 Tax=Gongylonema pulchrum TaxID=637853 RepID=A0A183DMW7_9BILA|nr:unnamed protein product [Gongylonema pulchrum]